MVDDSSSTIEFVKSYIESEEEEYTVVGEKSCMGM
jgi:hypothetical protein